jgi:hypothetical protein
MESMLPTKRMAISIIARHSGLSATQQSGWDIKEASIRILSTDYRVAFSRWCYTEPTF